MTIDAAAGRSERLAAIARLREALRDPADAFVARHQADTDAYRAEISAGLAEALETLRRDAHEMTAADSLMLALVDQAREYIDWMQWALWDLPYFAAVLKPDRTRFRRLTAACGLVYLSFRVIDDMLDRHYLYRGRRPTLLATFTRSHGQGRTSEGLSVLAALLVCFEGLSRMVASAEREDRAAAAALREVIASARRAIVGTILEHTDDREWTPAYYDRLIRLKNVDYWRILNAALDPDRSSPLDPFLEEYYALAQRLNDVQDHTADEARGQPNLLSIARRTQNDCPELHGPDHPRGLVMDGVEEALARDVLRLGDMLMTLPEDARGVAALKLAESLDEAGRLGLFAPFDLEQALSADAAPDPVRLVWDSTAEECLERLGPDALEDVACMVCGSREGRLLFRKHGFACRRCIGCSHVFVSPRVRDDVRARIAADLGEMDDDPFLDAQRIQAEHLCRVFRRLARGPRLLDVGFGRGYLMHLAQGHGFQAYGVDRSATLVNRLSPVFGRRLAQVAVDDAPLPWGAFDVVTMSHVLEHLADPREALARVHAALNDDGLLYLAVPDIDSVQFRIFGKRWNVVSPIVHVQYFTEASLRRAVEESGFEVISRLEPPPQSPMFASRVNRLFRDLGGSETGELALLCRPVRGDSSKRDAALGPDHTGS